MRPVAFDSMLVGVEVCLREGSGAGGGGGWKMVPGIALFFFVICDSMRWVERSEGDGGIVGMRERGARGCVYPGRFFFFFSATLVGFDTACSWIGGLYGEGGGAEGGG